MHKEAKHQVLSLEYAKQFRVNIILSAVVMTPPIQVTLAWTVEPALCPPLIIESTMTMAPPCESNNSTDSIISSVPSPVKPDTHPQKSTSSLWSKYRPGNCNGDTNNMGDVGTHCDSPVTSTSDFRMSVPDSDSFLEMAEGEE
jgi:hypothetical protein